MQLDLTAYHALTFLADWDWAQPATTSADPTGNGRVPIEIKPVVVESGTA